MFQNWLHPLSGHLSKFEGHQLGSHISRYTEAGLPNLKSTQVALIGIGEGGADAVRNELYQLSYTFNELAISDLGNVRKKSTSFLIPLVKELIESKIFPIIIGAQPSHALAQYKAFQSLQHLINLVIVDERLAFTLNKKASSPHFLNEVINSRHSQLFHISFIGTQAHFVPPGTFEYLDKRHFDYIRLGKAKAHITELEPIIRDGDLLSLNINALKAAEAPGQSQPSPSGFQVEDACQISRYAGLSDKLKAFGIYGYRRGVDRKGQTAKAIAQMIWYFLDGYHNRKGDFPASTEGLMEYIVEFKTLDYQLTFWKSEKSGRWWMQVPVKTQHKYQRHRLVPCSYNDYLKACQDELPDRLLNALRRFA
jgi:formiminoglutamase